MLHQVQQSLKSEDKRALIPVLFTSILFSQSLRFAYQFETKNPMEGNPGPKYSTSKLFAKVKEKYKEKELQTDFTKGGRSDFTVIGKEKSVPGPQYFPEKKSYAPELSFPKGLQRKGVSGHAGELHRKMYDPSPAQYTIKSQFHHKKARPVKKIYDTKFPQICKAKQKYFKDKQYCKIKKYPPRKWNNTKAQKMDFIDRTKAQQLKNNKFKQLIPGPAEYFANPGKLVTIIKDDMKDGRVRRRREMKTFYTYKRDVQPAQMTKFRQAKREALYDQTYGNPGPQSYNQDLMNDGWDLKKGSMKAKQPTISMKKHYPTPGPGGGVERDYIIRYPENKIQFQFKKTQDNDQFLKYKSSMQKAGNVHYNINKSFEATKPKRTGMAFQNQKRKPLFDRKNESSGPGVYGIPERRKLNSSFSFGKQSRFKSFDPEQFYTPGPDTYNLPSQIVTAPKYLFRKKTIKTQFSKM